MPKEWTLTGAARAAREARLSTARFLTRAPLAVQWQHERLVRGRQMWLRVHQHPKLADLILYGGMGHAPPYRDPGSMAKLLAGEEAARLASADLYVLSPDMLVVVVAAAQGLSVEDLRLLDESDMPTPTGCVMLPHPVLITTQSGDLSDLRALLWGGGPSEIVQPDLTDPFLNRVVRHPGVRVTAFTDTYGPVQPDSFRHLAAIARNMGTPLPPLMSDGLRMLAFHAPRGAPGLFRLAQHSAQELANAEHEAAAADGKDDR
jgi:hypothetical protein